MALPALVCHCVCYMYLQTHRQLCFSSWLPHLLLLLSVLDAPTLTGWLRVVFQAPRMNVLWSTRARLGGGLMLAPLPQHGDAKMNKFCSMHWERKVVAMLGLLDTENTLQCFKVEVHMQASPWHSATGWLIRQDQDWWKVGRTVSLLGGSLGNGEQVPFLNSSSLSTDWQGVELQDLHLFVFWDRVSYNPNWVQIQYVAKDNPELSHSASTSQSWDFKCVPPEPVSRFRLWF